MADHKHPLPDPKARLLGLIRSCRTFPDLAKARTSLAQIMLTCSDFRDDLRIQNALLGMYARCGAVDEAKEAFDGLPSRDALAWNALISCYARLKRYDDALACFRRMKGEGVSPDPFTFACILKVCSNLGLLGMAEEIHAEVGKIDVNLLQENVVLATAMLNAYARCGKVEKAREVFDGISCPDVVAWSAMIGGYARNGLGIEALKCFGTMQKEGLVPDVVTFVSLLKACGNVGSLKNLEASGRSTWSVDSEASSGRSSGSLDMDECTPELTMVDRGRRRGSGSLDVEPSESMWSLEMGEEIHAEISRQGMLETNVVLGTAVVDMYAKHGAMVKARDAFDKLPVRNVVSWNSLIAGHVRCGSADEALKCFDQMGEEGIPPDAATFLAVIKACASTQRLDTGERIHSEIDRHGLLTKREGVAVLGTALVHMYAKCGALSKAEEMFFSMLPEGTAVSWNALMAGYAQHGLGHETLGLFEEMRKAGIAPNTATLVYVLQACGSTGCLEMGEAIHAELEGPGPSAERNAVLDTALLDMYAKCGKMRKAQEVFDAIRARTTVSWNALIAGYARQGLDEEALLRFQEMCRGGFTPDAVTLLPVLKACGNRGSLEIGRRIHGAADEQGLLSDDAILGTAVIDMYAKCGALGEARAVFDEVPAARKSIEAWNALIMGHAQLGQAEKVLRMCCTRGDGSCSIKPNAVTFLVAMMACSHAGLVQEGWMVFDEMEDGFGLAPALEHYGCLIDLFGRAGQFDIAVAVVEAAPCADRLPLWLGLLGACGKWADVELGQWAYGRLMQLDHDSSRSTSAHVCMANAYASAIRLV